MAKFSLLDFLDEVGRVMAWNWETNPARNCSNEYAKAGSRSTPGFGCPAQIKSPALSLRRTQRQGRGSLSGGTFFGFVGREFLLDRAADVREDVLGVGPDEADGADYNDQDHRQHDGILGYVLTLLVSPEFG
jgi:hypothetical protein